MSFGKYKFIILILILLINSQTLNASNNDTLKQTADSGKIKNARLPGVLIAQGVLYVGSITGLYYAWYHDYAQSSFHFFDDNNEWLQMDKAGHITAAYYISRIGYESYRWSGVNNKKSVLGGGLLGLAYLANIEILDAFSSEWGFSSLDFVANTTGCLLFMSQQWIWKEQRFVLKYSFHPTKYSEIRPNLLGKNIYQSVVKDYNGQTYWLSGNISSFLPSTTRFPRWINISFGYGAEGMIGANNNMIPEPGTNNVVALDYKRYRQYYLSLDVDLTRIRTRSKTLHYIFAALNFIKIPFPAIEYNSSGQLKIHPLYF